MNISENTCRLNDEVSYLAVAVYQCNEINNYVILAISRGGIVVPVLTIILLAIHKECKIKCCIIQK